MASTLTVVKTVTHQEIQVLNQTEADFYNHRRDQYVRENAFTETSDLADLDRLLFFELMSYRWVTWLSSGVDYDGDTVEARDEDQLRKNLKDMNSSISEVKRDLGLTRNVREKEKIESVGAYLIDLKKRAKQFGIHRNRQVDEAMTLFMELKAIVGTYDRSNALERQKVGIESCDDIVDWVRANAIPRFDALDKHFRDSPDGQRYWVGTL